MIDIDTGGGSVARVNALRRQLVGPERAGAVPGPVACALGGADPTVTDADDDSPALLILVGCAGCR